MYVTCVCTYVRAVVRVHVRVHDVYNHPWRVRMYVMCSVYTCVCGGCSLLITHDSWLMTLQGSGLTSQLLWLSLSHKRWRAYSYPTLQLVNPCGITRDPAQPVVHGLEKKRNSKRALSAHHCLGQQSVWCPTLRQQNMKFAYLCLSSVPFISSL